MTTAVFWTVATVMVVLSSAAVVVPIFWVRPAEGAAFGRRRLLAMLALAAAIPLSALGVYSLLGSPALVGAAPPAAVAAMPPHAGAAPDAAGEQPAGDMRAAIERLEARLAKEPGDAAGWQLLAQSYEFMGRAEDAARARERAAGSAGAAAAGTAATGAAATSALAAPPTAGPSAATSPQGTALAGGKDVNALVLAAQTARRQRDFKTSIAAFEQLARRGAMTADLWADYADAVGADRRTLDEASEPLIRKALALDPNHAKALWLLGSLQVQRGDYRGALATWERMQKVLQPGSSDARLIAENIAEARAALGGPGPGAATLRATAAALPAGAGGSAVRPAAAAGIALRGEVQLDARFRNKVAAGTVLFVFAKAVGQPGPPVAVLRTTAARWPVAFVLDDSLAMMPGRNLSNSRSVVVEARLSRSGSANPSPGDLRGSSAALDPHGSAPLRIVIDEQIG